MLYNKFSIGGKELTFCACASVNVCYFHVFHEDFIKILTSDDGLAATAMMKMAFIMAKYGETNDRKAVNRMTEDDFCNWLDQFTSGDLINALPAIQNFYMAAAGSTIDAKKNSEVPSEK